MQKIIFGIFAHPDDEAFGPCGTLLREVQDGSELHLVLLTSGAGNHSMNPDHVDNLSEVRLKEWQTSTQIIGASSTQYLGYSDGNLNNDDQITIAAHLEKIVHDICDNREDIEIEFITFDLNGLTGHIDHIVAARAACLAFFRLRQQGVSMNQVRLYCLAKTNYPKVETGFVFMEPGRDAEEIRQTVDARDILDTVHKVMQSHVSQRADYESQTTLLGDSVAIDHFLIIK